MSGKRVQVAIVGGGPVGLTLANLLGLHGVRTTVLERNAAPSDGPRAVVIDAESLRTMQAAGIYGQLEPDLLQGFQVDYVNEGGRWLFGYENPVTAYGYAAVNSFDQPALENRLVEGLDRFPHVDIRFGNGVEEFEASPDGVLVRGRRANGSSFELEADYLVGCDGARSRVREALGIGTTGEAAPEKWLVIDTIDPHLDESIPCRFICDPARPGMTLRKRRQKRRWEWMVLPGECEESLLEESTIRSLLAAHTRPEQVTVERKRVYTFQPAVAERFRAGRVLIAGDAAHTLPPFAGQGMNNGIRDAMNLSWKLALLARGKATEMLLDTYEIERRAQVLRVLDLVGQVGSLLQSTSHFRASVRDFLLSLVNWAAASRDWFQHWLIGWIIEPSIEAGAIVTADDKPGSVRPVAGRYLIQPPVRTAAGQHVLLDDVLGPGFALLGYDQSPQRTLSGDVLAFWTGLGTRFVRIVPRGGAKAEGENEVVDSTGDLGTFFAGQEKDFVAVRPDRFCAAQFSAEQAADVTKLLRERLGAS
jgi:3-(3-hydroxy-phenyl)propionate hydroxylase